MYDICAYNMSMYVCVHILEFGCVHRHVTERMWKPEANFVCWSMPSTSFEAGSLCSCSISGLAYELPGTLLSTSLTDACLGLALHGFSGFESIACALSTEPSLQFPKQCFQVTVALLSKCQERLVLNS